MFNSYYSMDVIRNQVSGSNKNMLNLHMNQLDYALDGVGNYVYQLSDEDDLAYFQPNVAASYNDYVEAKLRLFNTISTQSNFYTTIDSIFVYSSEYDDMIYTQKFGNTFEEREAIYNEVWELMKSEPKHFLNGQWNVWKGKNQYYLFYLLKNEGVYVGAWVNMEKLVTPFKFIDFGESGRALITTANFTPITQREFIEKEGINLRPNSEQYSLSGNDNQFMVMSEESSSAAFNIIALIPEHTILEKLPFLQRISSFITIGAILFLLLFIFLMRKVFLIPIRQIVMAMKQLRKGNLDIRLPHVKSSTEFEMMNESFNNMISEIRHLKIDVYEKKLNLQSAELKHLQLQINPHFFLNSLNIIYNLATVKEYALIQEMSKSLANYFRFMFKSNSYFVSLKDEILHTKNYLKIQQLRFPDEFSYKVNIPEDLMKYQIPPLVIQSLVENTIKHAFNMDDPIEIDINVRQDDKTPELIQIEIRDTGEGFPEEILKWLEKDEPLITEEGKRIGIWNVKRRLHLLYGENNAHIHFSNGEKNGAVITIHLPKKFT